MALKFSSGFDIEASEIVDSRIQLTKDQMATADIGAFPDVYFCFCPDDNSFYRFDYNDAFEAEPAKCFTKLEMGGGSVSEVSVGNVAPSNPQVGDTWLDTSVTPNVLKRWDGTSWVPVSPNVGDLIYDEITGDLLVFDGTYWKSVGSTKVALLNTDGSVINPSIRFYTGTADPNTLSFGNVGDVYFRQYGQ